MEVLRFVDAVRSRCAGAPAFLEEWFRYPLLERREARRALGLVCCSRFRLLVVSLVAVEAPQAQHVEIRLAAAIGSPASVHRQGQVGQEDQAA